MNKFLSLFALVFLAFALSAQGTATVCGTVWDTTGGGQPVSYASVQLFAADGQPVAATTCGLDGQFRLQAPAGDYRLHVALLGYYSTGSRLNLVADMRLDTILLLPDYVNAVLASDLFPYQVVALQEMYDINRGHCVTTVDALYRAPRHAVTFHSDCYHPFDRDRGLSYRTVVGYTFHFKPRLGGWGVHAAWEGGHFVTGPGNRNPEVWNAYMLGFEYERFRPNGHLYHFRFLYRYTEIFEMPFQFSFDWDIPRLFGLKGLSFCGNLDLWGDGFEFGTENVSFKGVLGNLRLEPQVWYNLSRLWGSRGKGRYLGREGLGVFFKLSINSNHPGGWHYGRSYYRNYGLNITPCFGLRYDF